MNKHPKLAFVVPRFAESIIGGAETLVAKLAESLQSQGYQIDILTTCAIDNRTWENHFPAGNYQEFGLQVKRFEVNQRNLDIWIPLQIKVAEGMILPVKDQLDWMAESVNSQGLYQYIIDEQNNYDLFIFAPYLFGTTFWGSLIIPEKSLLIPCLHDESYAYTEVIQSMFRQVKGFIFNAKAEQDFAESLYGPLLGGEVGMGFDVLHNSYIANLAPYFSEEVTYLLYLGRKETGKNLHLLIDYFNQLQIPNLKLVIAGGGDFSDVADLSLLKSGNILDLGRVSEEEKHRLLKYCLALCQPSTNESFSIVLMEAWQFSVPVLVHAKCAVTKQHVIDSQGGLYFASVTELGSVIKTLMEDSQLAETFGENGRKYLLEKYNWPAVTERFQDLLPKLLA